MDVRIGYVDDDHVATFAEKQPVTIDAVLRCAWQHVTQHTSAHDATSILRANRFRDCNWRWMPLLRCVTNAELLFDNKGCAWKPCPDATPRADALCVAVRPVTYCGTSNSIEVVSNSPLHGLITSELHPLREEDAASLQVAVANSASLPRLRPDPVDYSRPVQLMDVLADLMNAAVGVGELRTLRDGSLCAVCPMPHDLITISIPVQEAIPLERRRRKRGRTSYLSLSTLKQPDWSPTTYARARAAFLERRESQTTAHVIDVAREGRHLGDCILMCTSSVLRSMGNAVVDALAKADAPQHIPRHLLYRGSHRLSAVRQLASTHGGLYVGLSQLVRGQRGLFTSKPIRRGEWVLAYEGAVLTEAQFDAQVAAGMVRANYALNVGGTLADSVRSKTGLVICPPEDDRMLAQFVNYDNDGHDNVALDEGSRTTIFCAKVDIHAGEELVANFGDTWASQHVGKNFDGLGDVPPSPTSSLRSSSSSPSSSAVTSPRSSLDLFADVAATFAQDGVGDGDGACGGAGSSASDDASSSSEYNDDDDSEGEMAAAAEPSRRRIACEKVAQPQPQPLPSVPAEVLVQMFERQLETLGVGHDHTTAIRNILRDAWNIGK